VPEATVELAPGTMGEATVGTGATGTAVGLTTAIVVSIHGSIRLRGYYD
jgi:hypothetical protein